MKELFLEVVKLSLGASVFVAAVVLLRLVFRKAPRWVFCLLWALAAVRLVLPLHIETSFSVMPGDVLESRAVTWAMHNYTEDIAFHYEGTPGFKLAMDAGCELVNTAAGKAAVTRYGSFEKPVTTGDVLAWVWLGGVALMLGYTAVSWAMLRRRVRTAVRGAGNVWECESVDSPFVLGLFRPRIYLPFGLEEPDRGQVIAHERAHLRRGDHWWKPLGFLLLSVHWFNPVLWAAYVLLCRDIEGACDEKVIASMTREQKQAYSRALLRCSVHRRRIAACPVAFGEVGTKQRIQAVMHYKKPAFWIVVTAVAASLVAAVLLLTDPAKEETPPETTAPPETAGPVSNDPVVTPPQTAAEWYGPLLGESRVYYEILDSREDSQDREKRITTYRFFLLEDDGKERDILTVEGASWVSSGDVDRDGLVELFSVTGNTYRLYDLVDGTVSYTELAFIPDGMLSYEVLLGDSSLYLYKEKWIRFFLDTETYLLELAKLDRTEFLYARPTGAVPAEISEQQFREGYRRIHSFLDQERTEQQRWVAYQMLLELDQNCTPETAVELTGPEPYGRLFDKRRYARENSAEWQSCMAQLGVLFDRDPAALLRAMAARKENWDPETHWLVSSRYYYDAEALAKKLKQMEDKAETDREKELANAFRASYEALEPPVMDTETLLSGTAGQLWNAFVWDTEAVLRCFGKADREELYRMRNLLWSEPRRPEQRSLEKCYSRLNHMLSTHLSEGERDAAYMFLVLLEWEGGFRDVYVPGEAFDYQRFFDKSTYTDGATAEYWATQCKDVFRQSPQEFLFALNAWDGEAQWVDRILVSLAHSFYGEEKVWFEEELESLIGFSGDALVLKLLEIIRQ